MLIDDNKIDNFFHERVIQKSDAACSIIKHESAREALNYLQCENNGQQPDIIFLDINMPGMDGWEFIELYKKQCDLPDTLVIIFTYDDPDDEAMENTKGVFADFRHKPLTKEMLDEILQNYFSSKG